MLRNITKCYVFSYCFTCCCSWRKSILCRWLQHVWRDHFLGRCNAGRTDGPGSFAKFGRQQLFRPSISIGGRKNREEDADQDYITKPIQRRCSRCGGRRAGNGCGPCSTQLHRSLYPRSVHSAGVGPGEAGGYWINPNNYGCGAACRACSSFLMVNQRPLGWQSPHL